MDLKAIIGLGNPGKRYYNNRHNIGFRVVDVLCQQYGGIWQTKNNMEVADVSIRNHPVILIKPQTFMNSSGQVIPWLKKQGIDAENIVVIHDELELPFGTIKAKLGGSAKGHNGLKSIIEHCGQNFLRLRFGIGRPEDRAEVPDYVLNNFTEDPAEVERLIYEAAEQATQLISGAQSL